MQKRLHLLMALLAFMVTTAMAQITTSGLSGSVTASGEDVIGATIEADGKILRNNCTVPEAPDDAKP